MSIPIILEYGSHDDEYEFNIKGHSLNDEDVIDFINSELHEEGENLIVDKILKKEENAYSSSRFYEGQDASDEGFSTWINFVPIEQYKKGYGKSTRYTVKLKRYKDDWGNENENVW